jgi:predicted RNase H-like HicB family nuclease
MTTNTLQELTWSAGGEERLPARAVYIPSELLSHYVGVAMRAAIPQRLEGETWYADLPGFPGVWADGLSPKQCLDTLEEVLRDWLLIKIVDQDRDIPVVDDIDLNYL